MRTETCNFFYIFIFFPPSLSLPTLSLPWNCSNLCIIRHYIWGSHCANWRRSTETAFAFLILLLQSIKSMRAHFYYGTHWVLFANFVTFSLFIIFNALEYKIDWNNLTCCLVAGNIFFFAVQMWFDYITRMVKHVPNWNVRKTKTKNHFELTHRCLIWCKLCWSYGRYWHISHSENYLIENKKCAKSMRNLQIAQ